MLTVIALCVYDGVHCYIRIVSSVHLQISTQSVKRDITITITFKFISLLQFNLLFVEAGCADGWIYQGLVFRGVHSTEDYHGEMNSKVFEEWVSYFYQQCISKLISDIRDREQLFLSY